MSGIHSRYIILGLWGAIGTQPISPRDLTLKNLSIGGASFPSPKNYYQAMQFAARVQDDVPLADLVSHRFGIHQAADALQVTENGHRHQGGYRSRHSLRSTKVMTIDLLSPPSTAKPHAPLPDHVTLELVREIDIYELDGIEEGFHEAWKRVQQADTPPLVWTPLTGGHWVATRGAVIDEIYRHPDRFSSRVIWVPREAGEAYEMVPTKMDPPEHTPYRKAIDKGLNLARIRKMEADVRAVAVELIEGFADKGACDFARDFAGVFPVRVFLALADLPMEDAPMLNALAKEMTRPSGTTPEEQGRALQAANRGFFDYVAPIIEARRRAQAPTS